MAAKKATRMNADMTPKELEPKPIRLEQLLIRVDPGLLACVDERKNSEHKTWGIKIPGAIYGVLDVTKTLTGMTEDEARKAVIQAGLPIGAHVDEHHHEKGCGYAKLVETKPEAVSAVEAIPATDRLAWVKAQNGTVLHYVGDHKPTHAVINYRKNFTIDPEKAAGVGIGPFDLDLWTVHDYAKKLGIDPTEMSQHIEKIYRQTVTALSGITHFDEIR